MIPIQRANQILCSTVDPPQWDSQPDFSLRSRLDLWKISIKHQMHQIVGLAQYLSPAELERASRYHQQNDKDRFTIGKGMLRRIISLYTVCDPSEIVFEQGINHKPGILHHSLEFNVSYSNDCIIIGLSQEAIGVDIEYIYPDFEYQSLLEGCFMDAEIHAIISSSNPLKLFYQFWTRKEALLKAASLGLGDYLTDFSCLDGTQIDHQFLCLADDWHIRSFFLKDHYAISVAQKETKVIGYIDGQNFIF